MMQEFVQQINDTIKHDLKNVHTAMPGTIISFDAEKMLATVQPVMKFKKPNGETMDYPQITGVPVVFPQGNAQNATMAFPVLPGDSCLVVIAEQSIDYWMYGQETATDLAFDMTNGMCIPGMFASANSVVRDACSQNAVILDVNGTRITIKSGLVQIDAPAVVINSNVTVNGDVIATGVSLMRHTHTGDSGGSTSMPR